jgi:FKBP-type peptidyl-prolyl cis-trans isomerase
MVAVSVLSLAAAIASAQTAKPRASASKPSASKAGATAPKPVVTPSGLQYWDLKTGTGAEAVKGKTVLVTYVGRFTNGKVFDSSPDPKKPFSVKLGAGDVIKGWDEGIAGMKVGGKRKLQIPPQLAYGAKGYPGVIPPNSTLVFEVGLVAVK